MPFTSESGRNVPSPVCPVSSCAPPPPPSATLRPLIHLAFIVSVLELSPDEVTRREFLCARLLSLSSRSVRLVYAAGLGAQFVLWLRNVLDRKSRAHPLRTGSREFCIAVTVSKAAIKSLIHILFKRI